MSPRRIVSLLCLALVLGTLLLAAQQGLRAAPPAAAPQATSASAVARKEASGTAAAQAKPSEAAVAPEMVQRLEALGYTEQALDDPDPARVGVTRNDPRASAGVSVYCTGRAVRFLALDGTVLEELPLDIAAARTSGCLAKPFRRGLVTVVRSPILSVHDLKGNPRWSRLGPYHHDVDVAPDYTLYTFAQYDTVLRRGDRKVPIVGQQIRALDPRGRMLRSLDLVPLFARFVSDERLRSIDELAPLYGTKDQERYVQATDVFHPNTVRLVRWPHAGGSGRHALVALREIDRVAVVDLERQRLVWEWGAGEIIGPHDPWLLESGNVLLFDNGARPGMPLRDRRWSSRLVEVDPRTNEIVWQYRADPPRAFFSPSRGGVQPLPNGNLLVTESTKGRAFEMTRGGEIVWEFWNPEFDEKGVRLSLYRMHRMSTEDFEALRGSR